MSSPMMPAFMVSAPGKVIVFGEHAVVHGKAAIAAAISLRSYLLVTTLSKSRRTVTLRFPDINLVHTWDIDSLPWSVFSHPSKKKFYYDLVTSLDPELVEAMRAHVLSVSMHERPEIRKIHQSSASAFLYLYLSLSSRSSCACIYTLRSTIPIGAGLGSSASISVCLSTALLLQMRALAGPHPDQPRVESHVQLERINRWAFVAEMCIHGNPSGVDNTVATEGKAVLFRRKDYRKPPVVTPLRGFPKLPLLLVNTKQERSTQTEVEKVRCLLEAHPTVCGMMLESINTVTESAHDLISSTPRDGHDQASLRHLGELIRINHGLLVSLGASHPRLERIRELVDHAGIGWTKLTGAGGGGCAITMLKPEVDASGIKGLRAALEAEDFEIYQTMLGAEGVGVLWPAVFRSGTRRRGRRKTRPDGAPNGEVPGKDVTDGDYTGRQCENGGGDVFDETDEDEAYGYDEEPGENEDEDEDPGGKEIDQNKFLKAVGIDGVERLVGVAAKRHRSKTAQEAGTYRQGWQFWDA